MKTHSHKFLRFIFALVLAAMVALPLKGCGGGSGNPVSDDHAYAIAIQSDGKIVAAGDSYNGAYGWEIALMRFNADGTLDTTFGKGGKVLTLVYGSARALAIQSDGKIVAGGLTYDGMNAFVLMRYNTDGSPDSTFGINGEVLTSMNGGIAALAIQSDGNIVAAGYAYNVIGYDFALVRYVGSNGALDTTFGTKGVVRTSTTTALMPGSGASSVAIQSDGKIVAAGGSCLIRYNTPGTLDTSFGVGGEVVTGSYYEQTPAVAIQSDGNIVAAGSSYNGIGYDLALTRYNNIGGSPDTTFAGSGRVVATVMSLYPLAPAQIVVDPSGKILAAGFSQYQSVIVRFNSDGTPDSTLASSGMMMLTGGSYSSYNSIFNDIAVQGDGKFLAAGTIYDMISGYDFVLERHNIDGSLDTGFGSGGMVSTGM